MTNESEREQWGGATGRVWVDRQAELDGLLGAATDLLLAHAGLAQGQRVLDVGCGAGASALAAARIVSPGGHVTGLDLSAQLLALARSRAEAAGLAAAVTLREGDAQTDRAPGGPFDRAVSRFGVMFFADPVAALATIRAQMRPGGRLAAVTWGPAAENPWFSRPSAVAAARLGPPPPTDPAAPGPLAFADPGRVTALLGEAGWREVSATPADVALVHPDLDGLAALSTEVGPAARLLRLREADAAERQAMQATLREAFRAYAADGGVRIPARLIAYGATA